MITDSTQTMRAGEIAPIYGTVSAATGNTVTISSGTYTLSDYTGKQIKAGAVTGVDPGALSSARVWVTLDTTSIAAGVYTLEFTVVFVGSDNITRTRRPSATVVVLAA